MIINDDPSPITRLCTEAKKITPLSLYKKVRSWKKAYVGYTLVGIITIATGVLYYSHAVVSQTQKNVASIDVQKYNACVFGKDVTGNGDTDISFDVDAECMDGKDDTHNVAQDSFTQEIAVMLEGYPMEDMAKDIGQQDKVIAGLIVGIARQESQWGKYAPSKDGIDCYNYWGYKTTGTRGQAKGYACFGSPEEAVQTIAKRLNYFVYDTNRDTPAKMVTPWKCGTSCASHSPESVARWVGTVNTYYTQVVAMDAENKTEQNTFLSRK